ncbi:MAG: N-methyl-L-tryptophan oxidase [Planctomycetes bacterium]|nr:N-methyl-L-tryptophan oxidase [Planctomycetota bacterium]
MANFDAIVLGTGGVGSAAMYQLALRGASVVGLDRFSAGHNRGSSHGLTRVIRMAYFEHPDYVPLLRRTYELWEDLEQRSGQKLYHETGLLEIGPADGAVVPGVLQCAAEHNLPVESLSAREVNSHFPALFCPDSMIGVLERRAGYLPVEQCIVQHIREAKQLGAEHRTGVTVNSWRSEGDAVVVETDQGTFQAGSLIVTAGAWSADLLAGLGVSLRVLRKPLYWYATDDERYEAEHGCPAFLYETPEGIFYGFPKLDPLGVKVGEHTGGALVDDPLLIRRQSDPAEEQRTRQFLGQYLPGVSDRVTDCTICMYTMTPDEHFIVDRHPDCEQVVFAAGLSGHGFKFAPVLGEALADLALNGQSSLPIGFLGCGRFVV